MTAFPNPLHEDGNGVRTSSRYGDPGDGVLDWFVKTQSVDGGSPSIGAKADAAVTNPASSASVIAALKGLLTRLATLAGAVFAEDAASTSGDAGIAVLGVANEALSSLTSADADYGMNAILRNGVGLTHPTPSAVATVAPDNAGVSAYVATLAVKATAGTLYGITGYNSNAADRFIQLHDKATAVSGGGVPAVIILAKAGSSYALDFGLYGRKFAAGIQVVNSTTGPTYTAASADQWIDAQFK